MRDSLKDYLNSEFEFKRSLDFSNLKEVPWQLDHVCCTGKKWLILKIVMFGVYSTDNFLSRKFSPYLENCEHVTSRVSEASSQ